MATIHLLLQGKGGVGKSFVASILFQYLRTRFPDLVFGYDTDPVNSTFAGYKEFNVEIVKLMRNDDIDPRAFDRLIEAIYGRPMESHIVVDNGASCFIALCGYLKENKVFGMLNDGGHKLFVHTLVTGGQALGDTIAGLSSLAKNFPGAPIVVWLNPYFGEIVNDGQGFYDFKIYEEHGDEIRSVVEMPALRPGTFGKDLEELLAKRWSFDTAVKSSLPLMTRSRLFNIWHDLEAAVDKSMFLEAA